MKVSKPQSFRTTSASEASLNEWPSPSFLSQNMASKNEHRRDRIFRFACTRRGVSPSSPPTRSTTSEYLGSLTMRARSSMREEGGTGGASS